MMHFKNEGFSLIEVMLGVVIMGLVLAPLFVLENSIVENVGIMAVKFRQYLSMQNFMYEARRSQAVDATEYILERKETDILQYKFSPISSDSLFKKNRNLYAETISVSEVRKKGEKQKLVNVRFKPPKVSA